MVTSPVGSASPAATAAAPVIAVVATDPRPPTSHTPTRRSTFIQPTLRHCTSVASCLSSAHRSHFMPSVKIKSVRWKAKQTFGLGLIVLLAGVAAAPTVAAARRARSASGHWSSPRRRASGTTRSPRAWRRSGGSAAATPFDVDTTANAGRFTHRDPGALRRRDLPPDHRHADPLAARSAPPSSASSAAAAATSACTPPRTRAATGRGTSGWSARASSATTRGSRDAPCKSSTAAPPPRAACRRPGRAPTSGTSSAPPRRAHVLAQLDESRPLAWCHRYDGGRSVYTAMGHTKESYAEPRFVRHLLGAIEMAAGRARFACAR